MVLSEVARALIASGLGSAQKAPKSLPVADSSSWTNHAVTTSAQDHRNAPFILILQGQSGPATPEQPGISVPGDIRRSAPVQQIDINKGGRQLYAVELATDPSLFNFADHGHRRNENNFYGSWQDQLSTAVPFSVPDAVWNRLRSNSRIWYRAHFADDENWTSYAVTTEDADAHNAPSFTISADTSATELLYPSGAVFSIVDEQDHPDYADPGGSDVPLIAVSGKRSTRLSANFRLSEFVEARDRFARISPALVDAVQTVRERLGKAIRIERGYTRAAENADHAGGQRLLISSRHASASELSQLAGSTLPVGVQVSIAGDQVLLDVNAANGRTRLTGKDSMPGSRCTVAMTGPEAISSSDAPEFHLCVDKPARVWVELAGSAEAMKKMRDMDGAHYRLQRVDLVDHGVFRVSDADWQHLSAGSYLHYRASVEGMNRGMWHSITLPGASSRSQPETDLEFTAELVDRADTLVNRVA